MKKLLKNARIVEKGNPLNGQTLDVLIEDGEILEIAEQINAQDAQVVTSKNFCISPGFFDLHVRACDPGFEHKEDLLSVAQAAKAGGFTGICLSPNTLPVTDSKSHIQYITTANKTSEIELFAVGAVSEKMDGENISEMYDMHLSGAVAFSDEKKSIQNADLLRRALLYTKDFGGLVMNFPNDETIAQNGMMNEGIKSTRTGLKGIPALAEELTISRDLFIAEYCEAPIHFSTITTRKSVELIRNAKATGLNVTCDVAIHNLVYTDSALTDFNTNFKTNPPLRTQDDVDALIEGVKDGTIDAITSDHMPENIENKACEFDYAAFGISSLETAFSLAAEHLESKISLEQLIHCFSNGPRGVLRLSLPTITAGAKANLTCFDPTLETNYSADTWNSKSQNNPEIGKTLEGKILEVIIGGI